MPFVWESSPVLEETVYGLPDASPPASPLSKSFAKTGTDVEGELEFVYSTTKLKQDHTPQELLLIGYGTVQGEERKMWALTWVGQGAITKYYVSDEYGGHKLTSYDLVQKWLPGFWSAQVTNNTFDPRKTRGFRAMSIFLGKESLEQAMSTKFDPGNRVTDEEINGALDDDYASDGPEATDDEEDCKPLKRTPQAEHRDGVKDPALHESARINQVNLNLVSAHSQSRYFKRAI